MGTYSRYIGIENTIGGIGISILHFCFHIEAGLNKLPHVYVLTSHVTVAWRKRDLFNSFMKLIEQNYRHFRDGNWYSGQLSISSKYLNIISKSISGNSAKTLIDHYVILKLKQELSGTDKSLKQLAWDYNFCDASFFTRYFRLHTGLTPRAWRLKESHCANAGIRTC